MKKLICAKDVELCNKRGEKVLFIDDNTLITPSAKDLARASGIEFSSNPQDIESPSCVQKAAPEKEAAANTQCEITSDMIYHALKALLEKGNFSGLLDECSHNPYVSEQDSGGLKLVRGNTVKMDDFDTGVPSNNVTFQELISKDDSKMSAGFLIIDHSRFDWDLSYEEIDYVIEGTLMVTINGKTFTACQGDVLFVPSGSKVEWGSPDRAKIFYTTYPANWADLM